MPTRRNRNVAPHDVCFDTRIVSQHHARLHRDLSMMRLPFKTGGWSTKNGDLYTPNFTMTSPSGKGNLHIALQSSNNKKFCAAMERFINLVRNGESTDQVIYLSNGAYDVGERGRFFENNQPVRDAAIFACSDCKIAFLYADTHVTCPNNSKHKLYGAYLYFYRWWAFALMNSSQQEHLIHMADFISYYTKDERSREAVFKDLLPQEDTISAQLTRNALTPDYRSYKKNNRWKDLESFRLVKEVIANNDLFPVADFRQNAELSMQ